MINKTRKTVSALFLPAVMLLSACAATPAVAPEVTVKEKAQARWDSLLSNDYATAYTYYSPGYRSTTSLTDLEIDIRMRRVQWTSAEYMDHDCGENTCVVRFNVGYAVSSPVPGVDTWKGYSVIRDQWIKTGGEWWYLPEK